MRHLFSDVAPFRRDPLAFLVERGEVATEPLTPLSLGVRPTYLLTDPEYVKPLLKMPEDLVDKGPMTRKFSQFSGKKASSFSAEKNTNVGGQCCIPSCHAMLPSASPLCLQAKCARPRRTRCWLEASKPAISR